MMTTATRLAVLDPTVEPIPAHAVVAQRPDTLDGKVSDCWLTASATRWSCSKPSAMCWQIDTSSKRLWRETKAMPPGRAHLPWLRRWRRSAT